MSTVQNDITPKMRTILVDWIEEVHMKFKLVSLYAIPRASIVSTWPSTSSTDISPSVPLKGAGCNSLEFQRSSSLPNTRKSTLQTSRSLFTFATKPTRRTKSSRWKGRSFTPSSSSSTTPAHSSFLSLKPLRIRSLSKQAFFKLINSCSPRT